MSSTSCRTLSGTRWYGNASKRPGLDRNLHVSAGVVSIWAPNGQSILLFSLKPVKRGDRTQRCNLIGSLKSVWDDHASPFPSMSNSSRSVSAMVFEIVSSIAPELRFEVHMMVQKKCQRTWNSITWFLRVSLIIERGLTLFFKLITSPFFTGLWKNHYM